MSLQPRITAMVSLPRDKKFLTETLHQVAELTYKGFVVVYERQDQIEKPRLLFSEHLSQSFKFEYGGPLSVNEIK